MSALAPELERLLQGCESEKLHLSGAIQSFGALLRVATATRCITHASANLVAFLGVEAADVLGKSVDALDWFPHQELNNLSPSPGKVGHVTIARSNLQHGVDATLIRNQDAVLVELEVSTGSLTPIALQQHQRPLMSVPDLSADLSAYHHLLLRAFQKITGFDRIMIYRFQDDWVGEVVAELVDPGQGAYLGLRFPASDIPAIARSLYLQNPSRMIHDASAAAVPILSLDDTPPDLTWSDLRSVSPVHLEYLHNMGVAASFSVPIKVAGKLWGLVSCHKSVAAILSPDQRAACVSLVSSYVLGLTSHISGCRLKMLDRLDRSTDRVLEAISAYKNPLDWVETNSAHLMQALEAGGFALAIRDDVVIAGEGPDVDGLALLDDWFSHQCKETMFASDHLAGVVPDSDAGWVGVAGFIAIKAKSSRYGPIRLYWFRAGEMQEVAWAGNPNKPVSEIAGAIRLSPRRSFERWVETRTTYCRAWSNEHRLVASKFRSGLLRWL